MAFRVVNTGPRVSVPVALYVADAQRIDAAIELMSGPGPAPTPTPTPTPSLTPWRNVTTPEPN